MRIPKVIERLSKVLLILSLFSFSASPITNLLGIYPPQQIANIMDFMKLLSMFIAVTLIAATLIIFVLGYFILTGWRSYKDIPKILRLCLAFALGYIALMFSGLISTFIQIPILPTVISSIILWIILRLISGSAILKDYCRESYENISIEKAIDVAISFLKKIEPEIEKGDVAEVNVANDVWEILVSSKKFDRKYKISVDGSSGGILAWSTE
jgi:hypothetical protein